MKAFEYLRPSSLEEACAALADSNGSAKVLAGGTDVLVQMRAGTLRPATLVSLRDVPGLDFVRAEADGGLTIGALAPLGTIEHSAGRERAVPRHRPGRRLGRLRPGAQPGDARRQPVQRGAVCRHGADPHRPGRRGRHQRRPQ